MVESISKSKPHHCNSGCIEKFSKVQAKDSLLCYFIEHAPAAFAIFDHEMRYLASSRRWIEDYQLGDQDIIGQSHYDVFPDIPDHWKDIHQRCLAGEIIENDAELFKREDGSRQCIRWKIHPWYKVNQEIGGIIMFTEIITEQYETQQQLHRERDFNKAVLDTVGALVIVLDRDGRIVQFNKRCEEVSGYSFNEVRNAKPWDKFLQKSEIEAVKSIFHSLQSGIFPNQAETVWITKSGEFRLIQWTNTCLIDPEDNSVEFVIGTGIDITQQKAAADKIHRLAFYDTLTGLPNRALFEKQLSEALYEANRHSHRLALLYIDINHFKNVNDAAGLYLGDQILKDIGERIQEGLGKDDILARMGGDKYLILLSHVHGTHEVEHVVSRTQDCFQQPFVREHHIFYLCASIGISMYPNDGLDEETLLKNADSAMFHAKRQSSGYSYYKSFMNASTLQKVKLEAAFRESLQKNDFFLQYQPQLDLATNQISGVEALVRWKHPEQGIIPPNHFIPLAEDTRLIIPLSEWIIEEACTQNKSWQDMGFSPIKMAVNISAYHFNEKDFVKKVFAILKKTGLDPRFLELELTEGILMDNMEEARLILHELRSIGIHVSIDDFGTGYSSLNYLKRLPINKLKIDRSFIRDLPGDLSDAALSRAIISMGHSLGLTVIAEGVETLTQREFLRLHQCNQIQGFLFSKPLPAWEMESFFMSQKKLNTYTSM